VNHRKKRKRYSLFLFIFPEEKVRRREKDSASSTLSDIRTMGGGKNGIHFVW